MTTSVPTREQLVQDHAARVYRWAYRLSGNPHDAEDLTQDVFVRAFRSLDGYTPDNLEGWLYRITRNLFLDKARRKTRLRFDPLTDEAAARLVGSWAGPDGLTDAQFDADVEQALAALPSDFRRAVVLCDVYGMDYNEVAAMTDSALGTVKSRIHRGRLRLRDMLAEHRELFIR